MKMPRRPAIDNSKDHVYFRPELNSFPPIQLPVYPRSTGLFTPLPGNLEIVKAGEKNFVQVFWVTAGRMKMNFNGRIEFLYPGYVVYSLPQEPYSIEISPDGWSGELTFTECLSVSSESKTKTDDNASRPTNTGSTAPQTPISGAVKEAADKAAEELSKKIKF